MLKYCIHVYIAAISYMLIRQICTNSFLSSDWYNLIFNYSMQWGNERKYVCHAGDKSVFSIFFIISRQVYDTWLKQFYNGTPAEERKLVIFYNQDKSKRKCKIKWSRMVANQPSPNLAPDESEGSWKMESLPCSSRLESRRSFIIH